MSPLTRNLILATAAAAALAAGYAVSRLQRAPQRPAESSEVRLADYTLPDTDGKPRNLGEWKGKVLVLNFWASWCPPCREEIPLLQSAQDRFGPQGLQVIGLAVDRTDAVLAYRKTVHMTYPALIDDATALRLMELYGDQSQSLPYTVIMDRSGRIMARKLGAFHGNELDQLVVPLLSSANMSSN